MQHQTIMLKITPKTLPTLASIATSELWLPPPVQKIIINACDIFQYTIFTQSPGLSLRQVVSVAYGPLVRVRENSMNKEEHMHRCCLVTYHTPKRHLHYDYSYDLQRMDSFHKKKDI